MRHPGDWRGELAAHGELRKEDVAPQIRDAANAAWRKESPWPLVLIGEAGAGKTCAALLLLRHLQQQAGSDFGKAGGGWFMPLGAWCNRIARAMWGTLQSSSGFKRSEVEEWADYSHACLAIVDDIGSKEASDHQHRVLLRCLDIRLGKKSVYTSNSCMEDLAGIYDDRIVSRLSAGTIAYVEGDKRAAAGKTLGEPSWLKPGWNKADAKSIPVETVDESKRGP